MDMNMTNKNINLAIETLREFVENTDNAKVKDAILELHPALAESKDEKIRMKMLEHFRSKTKKTWCNIPVEDIISYLEKQKEQDPKHPSSELEFADKYSKDVWEKLMTNFKTIQGYHIGCNDVSDIVLNAILDAFKWREQEDSLALIKNVVSYLEDCKYKPVVKICEELYRIDIPCHEDDFWKSKEYKKCVEILGDYYCQGIYSSNTYKLYVKRTKKEQKSAEIAPNQFDVTCGMQGLIAAFSAIPTIDEYPKDPVTSRAYSLMTRFEEIIRRGFQSMCGSSTCVNDVIVRETAQECVEVISTEKSEDNPEKSKVPVELADIYADEIIGWENAHPDWDKDRMRATALHFFKLRQKWSEEDSKRLLSIGAVLETSTLLSKEEYDADMAWIRELVNIQKHFGHKAKQEWSEEDKKTISIVIDVLRANHPDGFFKTSAAGDIVVTGITTKELIKKLQSLLSRPKPSGNWKPTKEQLGALLEAASEKEVDREDGNVLYQLYDQLIDM